MADDEKDVEVPSDEEKEKEAQGSPLTLQTFADEVNGLIDRAHAAGLSPLPVLATILAKRGMSLIDQTRATAAGVADRFLASLEGGHVKAKKK